jgi:hypothetical protein
MQHMNTGTTYIHVLVQTDVLAAHLDWTLRALALMAVVGSAFPDHWLALQVMFEWIVEEREEDQMPRLQLWMNALLPKWIRIKTENAHCNQV